MRRWGPYTTTYTFNMAKAVPVAEFRRNLAELLRDVADRREHVLVTKNGQPAAAVIPADEYLALEDTAEILSDPDAIKAIEEGLTEVSRGETVSLEDLSAELTALRDRG
jgi:antitoxin YefM